MVNNMYIHALRWSCFSRKRNRGNHYSNQGHRDYKHPGINKWGFLLLIVLLSNHAYSAPFDQGQGHVSATLGNGTLLNQDYIVLGVGYGYFLTNGLDISVDLNLWLDGDPTIYQVTPEVRYVFYMVPKIKPYIGTFYRRNYIEGFDDVNAYGYRAGVYWLAGANTYIGYGVTHSKLSDCKKNIYFQCEDTYSELSFVISLH